MRGAGDLDRIVRVRDDARPAWHALGVQLDRLRDQNQRPPCAVDPERWHSTDDDDKLAAIRGCQRCPVLDACNTVADHNAERFSIWGARDRSTTS